MSRPNSEYKRRSKLCRANNSLSLITGDGEFLYCPFEGPDGVYCDETTGEIFIVSRVLDGAERGWSAYIIEFEDTFMRGKIKDHGFNTFLGEF